MEPEKQAAGQEQLELSWQPPRGLISLSFTTLFLRILTLGVYHFWAKTEVRKRIWSAIRLNGEPLSYTGKGKELFLGFLIAFLVVILPVFLLIFGLTLTLDPRHSALNLVMALLYIGFAYLMGIAIYRAQRYRLARTRWRGIRTALDGSPAAYAWTYFWTLILIPFTLGWIIPWRTAKLQSIITNHTKFGDRPLRFTATSGRLYGPFALLWVGAIIIYATLFSFLAEWFSDAIQASQRYGDPFMPGLEDIMIVLTSIVLAGFVFALVSSWYQARTINHFASHTHFESAAFNGNLNALGLVWLSFSNFLILLVGAAILAGLAFALISLFVEMDSLRLPEGRAAAQVLGGLAPLVLLMGFSLFYPIVQARTAGYIIKHLETSGTAPIAEIVQSTGADLKYGEGLAEAFDIDAF